MCPAGPRAWGDPSPGRPYCPGQPFLSPAVLSPHSGQEGNRRPRPRTPVPAGIWEMAARGLIQVSYSRLPKRCARCLTLSGRDSIPGWGSVHCVVREGAVGRQPMQSLGLEQPADRVFRNSSKRCSSFSCPSPSPQNMAPHLHPLFRGM